MNPTHDTRSTRRWLPAAAVATVALVAALWAGLGRDTSETHAPELASADAAVVLPEATEADAPTAPPVSPLDTPSPTSLSSGRASLTLRLEADGLVAAPPYLRITRQPDGETEMRSIGERLTTAWPAMPAGSYTIESLNDTWVVDEPQVTLAGGEVRTVTLSSRRTAAVRVAGAFSGALQPTDEVRVLARVAGGDERDVDLTSRDELTDGRFVLSGLPAELADGSAVEALRVIAQVGRERAVSDWFTPASLDTTPTVLVRVPEPAIVGRVVRESAGDGLEAFEANQITLWLEDADAPPPAPPITVPHGPGVHATTIVLSDARSFARVQRDGRYELRLVQLPAGPVRVVASNSLDMPASAGPFTLSAKGLPLQVDLLLPASGIVRATVHTGVVEIKGRTWAVHSLAAVRTRPIGPDGKPGAAHNGYRTLGADVLADEAQLKFMVGSLEPGEYEVAVDLKPANAVPDAAPARHLVQRVRVEAGAPVALELDARGPPDGGTVSGSVILPAQLDPEQVEITLQSADGGGGRAVTLDDSGRYAFADVPPGEWIVRAGPPAMSIFRNDLAGSVVASGRREVHVEHGDSIVPPLDLTRPEVRLHVAGRPRTVFIMDGAQQGYRCALDAAGLGRIYGLPAGRYTVLGTTSDEKARTAFEVGAGDAVVMVEVP